MARPLQRGTIAALQHRRQKTFTGDVTLSQFFLVPVDLPW